jgi:hypothetical protein
MDVHRSARKHGVADEDAIHAAEGYLVAYPLSDADQEAHVVSCGWGRIVRARRSSCCCSTTERNWSFTRCA